METFVERHEDLLHGVLSCFDRVVITGTLADAGHAEEMTRELKRRGIRIFDFPRFAEVRSVREEIRLGNDIVHVPARGARVPDVR